jgi:hypothetical protein
MIFGTDLVAIQDGEREAKQEANPSMGSACTFGALAQSYRPCSWDPYGFQDEQETIKLG